MRHVYKAMVDRMIQAFMQIGNYHSWLKGGSSSKGLDQTSLKLKVVAHIVGPNFLQKQ